MATSLPTQIMEMDDWDEPINMLVYGDSGVGKTVLAGTCPNALFLSTETGTISARRQGSDAKVWRIDDWPDIAEAYAWLRDNEHPFDWVVIDSLSEMQVKAMRYILRVASEGNNNRDPDIPAIQDYQKWYNMIKKFISAFNELPVNVLWTALPMRKSDEEGNDIVMPLLTGQDYGISQDACSRMHVVAYLAARSRKATKEDPDPGTDRFLLCQAKPPYFAKDRYDALGRTIKNPTMPQIIEMIDKSETTRHQASDDTTATED